MKQEIQTLFDEYNKRYMELVELFQEDLALPRSFRLFNIRLRLALDIQIDFKGEVSLTRTREVKETYVLLIQLMEIWNAYEALYQFVKETNINLIKSSVSIDKVYSPNLLKEVGSLQILETTLDTLKEKYNNDGVFKKDLENLFYRIHRNDMIRPKLTKSCDDLNSYFKENKEISGIEILSLIYAERNMYYHNGETAKMGMAYRNRKYLLNEITNSFYKHILLLTTFILKKEIKKHS